MLKTIKNKLLLRVFGIKQPTKHSDLPKKLNTNAPLLYKSPEDFNKWSAKLFLNNHKN